MAIKRFSSKAKINTLQAPINATGGAISISGGYKYHTFSLCEGTQTGTFTPSGTGTVEVLVVGGGGGGGGQVGGGGGAGGLVYHASYAVTAGTGISVSAGRGGDGGRVVITTSPSRWSSTDAQEVGAVGLNSTFGTITANGGGGAGGHDSGQPYQATNGGSGGGGGASNNSYNSPGSATQGSSGGGTGYGYAGGAGYFNWAGGGGGGAGGVGTAASNAQSGGYGGAGGAGLQYFGDWYAAGGSGCNGTYSVRVPGTNYIGGRGGATPSGVNNILYGPSDGMAGRGAGGGGARDNDSMGYFNQNSIWRAGTGGSGTVIVRYLNN